MMANVTWIADVLRAAGLTVIERDGWKDRGHGAMGDIKGVICHHTSGPAKGNMPSLPWIESTAPTAPLSQLALGRDGTFYAVAAGRTNHAGKGRWQNIMSGNTHFIGIEAENDGKGEVWPQVQLDAYAVGVAAILKHIGADDVMAIGHKEWAQPKGRKVDPTFDMVAFREGVEAIMDNRPAPPPSTISPTRDMLRKGDSGSSVRQLQKLLGIVADGGFGPKTEAAVKAFQTKHHLLVDGRVGPKTWVALGIK